ncbi:MAG: glycosyltransferase family 4 protein [Anaerolineae bacterium]
MKILHWLNTFLPDIGGIQTFTSNLLPFQREQGHELLVIADIGFRGAPETSLQGDVPIHRFNMIRPLQNRNPKELLLTKIAIQKLIKSFDPDVIHMQPSGPELVYAQQVFRLIKKPLVVTIQASFDSIELQTEKRSSLGAFIKQANQVIAVSTDVKKWMGLAFELLADEIGVIPNAIPLQDIARTPLPFDLPILLALCRLDPQKNLSCLLRAFQIVFQNHPQARLIIGGSGSEKVKLKALAGELGLDDAVDFLGWVDPQEVPRLLNQSTVYASSSDYEGLSLSVLEAAQMARPIVATAADGMSEVVQDGVTGYLVEPNDHANMAEAICRLLANREQAQAFGNAGREHVESAFGMAQTSASYDQVYREVARVNYEVAI